MQVGGLEVWGVIGLDHTRVGRQHRPVSGHRDAGVGKVGGVNTVGNVWIWQSHTCGVCLRGTGNGD
eukprot:361484-Chlamydomonas_euryale.AAC.1